MSGFRFGLWIGFVAGLIWTALWEHEQQEDEILLPAPEIVETQLEKLEMSSS